MKNALISVFYKKDIEVFAQGLVELGYRLISSGGTARYLKEKGLPVTDVAEITGYPAILGHRVVTLHPNVHGGILALDNPDHNADLEMYKIDRIHLVCGDLYPVAEAIAKEGATVNSVMEMTDIGGPTLIRGAAKNYQNVIVICNPADRQWVLDELRANGDLTNVQRQELAEKVFDTMAAYDDAIRKFLAGQNGKTVDSIILRDGRELAYAENRCQNPAFLFSTDNDDSLAMSNFQVVSGDPSYISMADGSQILDILCLMAESFKQWKGVVPHIVVAGKHGNPCGAAIDWHNPENAIKNALYGDTTAVMGGEVVTNFAITDELAQKLFEVSLPDKEEVGRDKWGLDIILAPEFTEGAVDLLGKKDRRRLLQNPALHKPSFPQEKYTYRQVRGGFLRQSAPDFILTPDKIQFWTGNPFDDHDFTNAIIAWACCWRASSNTVALAVGNSLISLGCGQQDRIAGVRLCLDRANKAGNPTTHAIFASDGFFPYATSSAEASEEDVEDLGETLGDAMKNIIQTAATGGSIKDSMEELSNLADAIRRMDKREGPQLLADAGCRGGIVPADGSKLEDVKSYFQLHHMSVGFVGKENRGFSKH